MHVDVLFDPFGARWTDVRDGAVAAESAGLDGVCLYDHLAGSVHRERHVLECWTTLTAIAASVPRISRFLRPDPPPPVIVGGFGPKMAELAGRVGDGMNAPAGPNLGGLVKIGRQAYARSGRDADRFIVTTSGRPSSGERERLLDLGVDRLIVYVAPPYRDGVARVQEALDR